MTNPDFFPRFLKIGINKGYGRVETYYIHLNKSNETKKQINKAKTQNRTKQSNNSKKIKLNLKERQIIKKEQNKNT